MLECEFKQCISQTGPSSGQGMLEMKERASPLGGLHTLYNTISRPVYKDDKQKLTIDHKGW